MIGMRALGMISTRSILTRPSLRTWFKMRRSLLATVLRSEGSYPAERGDTAAGRVGSNMGATCGAAAAVYDMLPQPRAHTLPKGGNSSSRLVAMAVHGDGRYGN